MGVSHLSEIARIIGNVRSAEEPIAIIQNATCTDQKVVAGTVSTIEDIVSNANVSSPAVIIIGKVVEERRTLLNLVEQNLITSI
jgi:uroporphyrin-III C-methyltransferase